MSKPLGKKVLSKHSGLKLEPALQMGECDLGKSINLSGF